MYRRPRKLLSHPVHIHVHNAIKLRRTQDYIPNDFPSITLHLSLSCSTHAVTLQSILFYTVSHKKPCHFIFDNNSGVSWSIFIFFVLVETGRNTLQYTYLMVWWHHNCITSHVTKVCFIQLLLQVKYVEFEDRPKLFFYQNPVGMWKFFSQKTDKKFFYQELEKKNIGQLSV